MGNLFTSCAYPKKDPNAALTKKDLKILTQKTNYDEKTIKMLHKEFLKECPSGIMDKNTFNNSMNLYQVAFPSGDSSNFCEHVFRTFDQDKNGFIDFKEFINAIDVSSRGSVQEKLRWAFTMYDIDNNGVVEIEELTQIIEAMYQMIGKTSAKEKAKEVFEAMDTDNDGKITEEEFIEACIKDKQLSEILTPKGAIAQSDHEQSINEEKEEKEGEADISKETDILLPN